ncbi:carbohydrate kinase [Ancylobacter dichloromethanicus]|uniref:Carbohydrate kinase n=1 Tax=Ancylobacter dichloromethanicus TaxID=518825 RepID=A0A9W6J570_9HYPH|nr:carbohydrate kinase [Ancylobacter dichloromethanicus]MBS7556251.1 carbohydrate kinase [Ancylobacter dichloromethanicus]GLK70011.1 carbohydrate kinase [Ancylobacter dichloromethanicus]
MSAPATSSLPVLLCAGEALIDMVPRQTPEGRAFLPLPGGAVFNTAIAAARLGVSTRFWYGLSNDMFGEQLRAALDAAGADASLCAPVDRPSTLAFVTLDEGQARYLFLDENTAGRMLTPADIPDLPAEVGVLFFGGISLVNEPVGSAMEALAARTAADGQGRLIMLDPNIRPGFIRDEATYRARIFRLIGLSHVVKLSDEDLFWLTGPGEIATQAERVRAMGPRLVLITLGAKGARAFGEGLDATAPGQAVTVADTVGAGDTFNAAFLCALIERGLASPAALEALSAEVLGAALSFAVRAAAISVTRVGANPPSRAEVTDTR